jgi:glycosyltransferase involved in cell wall biosynthesis
MKKILILVPDLNLPGGVTNYYNTLQLEKSGNISYFTVNKLKSQSGVATVFRLISNYCKFFYTLIKNGYQLIHVNPSLDKRSFYRDLVFIFIARMLNRKTLVFFRGWLDSYEEEIKKSRFKSFLFRISYAKAAKYIVLSNIFKDKLIRLGVPSGTDFFIETTVADSSYLSELDLGKKLSSFKQKINFLFLARIEKEKGVYIAIEAYKDFFEKHPGISSCLIIAGDGPELQAVKKYVEVNKVPNIKFTGYVRGEMKKDLLLSSHIMLFPTYYGEGLPNSILEGMLYGMPVISRSIAGIPDVVTNGVNGFLSESLQPTVFAGFLSVLANNSELYGNIAAKNHEKAVDKFTAERVRERILAIYSKFN